MPTTRARLCLQLVAVNRGFALVIDRKSSGKDCSKATRNGRGKLCPVCYESPMPVKRRTVRPDLCPQKPGPLYLALATRRHGGLKSLPLSSPRGNRAKQVDDLKSVASCPQSADAGLAV